LKEVLDAQESALVVGEPDFATLDRTFHRIIVAAAGNQFLTRQYDALRDRHRRLTATTVAQDPTRIARFVAEHREIAAAVERGDGDAAAELSARHLYSAHELARRPRP
jgi:DNA-binding GntR family transcriptional regulator